MTPIIITPNTIKEISKCQGVLLPGGIDIDPMYYGIDNYSSYNVNPKKDEFERKVFYKAIKHQLPIFGICRGFQLIIYETLLTYNENNLPFSFRQHFLGHAQGNDISIKRDIRTHNVNVEGSTLYGQANISKMGVNSMHHQGVVLHDPEKNIASFRGGHEYINIVAWTNKIENDDDEDITLIEGIEIKLWGNDIVAVQWHPEELKDTKLIEYFFNKSYENKQDFSFDNFKSKGIVVGT